MYALKNNVQLIGSIGGKPEIKETFTGKRIAMFFIITTEHYWNTQGEKVLEMQWHRVVARGKIAEIVINKLDQGGDIAITGKLVTRSYPDKDGIRRSLTEVHINELLMIGARARSAKSD